MVCGAFCCVGVGDDGTLPGRLLRAELAPAPAQQRLVTQMSHIVAHIIRVHMAGAQSSNSVLLKL